METAKEVQEKDFAENYAEVHVMETDVIPPGSIPLDDPAPSTSTQEPQPSTSDGGLQLHMMFDDPEMSPHIEPLEVPEPPATPQMPRRNMTVEEAGSQILQSSEEIPDEEPKKNIDEEHSQQLFPEYSQMSNSQETNASQASADMLQMIDESTPAMPVTPPEKRVNPAFAAALNERQSQVNELVKKRRPARQPAKRIFHMTSATFYQQQMEKEEKKEEAEERKKARIEKATQERIEQQMREKVRRDKTIPRDEGDVVADVCGFPDVVYGVTLTKKEREQRLKAAAATEEYLIALRKVLPRKIKAGETHDEWNKRLAGPLEDKFNELFGPTMQSIKARAEVRAEIERKEKAAAAARNAEENKSLLQQYAGGKPSPIGPRLKMTPTRASKLNLGMLKARSKLPGKQVKVS